MRLYAYRNVLNISNTPKNKCNQKLYIKRQNWTHAPEFKNLVMLIMSSNFLLSPLLIVLDCNYYYFYYCYHKRIKRHLNTTTHSKHWPAHEPIATLSDFLINCYHIISKVRKYLWFNRCGILRWNQLKYTNTFYRSQYKFVTTHYSVFVHSYHISTRKKTL